MKFSGFDRIRIGEGYDAHRLADGRAMVLCGVNIPCEFGPLGHSDGDAPLHALCDALLGALAIGDIGKHFPDSDERYRGISSLILLRDTYDMVESYGYRLVNCDITIILQSPKIAPYIDQMRQNIADCLDTNIDIVSVKATTEEKMGFTGSGEGIAARAVVLLA